jgi:hypothetical protein
VILKYCRSKRVLALGYTSLESRSSNQLLQTLPSMNDFMVGEDDQEWLGEKPIQETWKGYGELWSVMIKNRPRIKGNLSCVSDSL